MGFTAHVDKQQVFDIIKTDPSMSYPDFLSKFTGKISDRYYYLLRTRYQEEKGLRPVPVKVVKRSDTNKPALSLKRKYVRSGLYSTKPKKIGRKDPEERRSYHKTTTCLILWSKDTSKLKPETLSTLHEVVRAMEKSKRLGFELVETVTPPRIELREYSK